MHRIEERARMSSAIVQGCCGGLKKDAQDAMIVRTGAQRAAPLHPQGFRVSAESARLKSVCFHTHLQVRNLKSLRALSDESENEGRLTADSLKLKAKNRKSKASCGFARRCLRHVAHCLRVVFYEASIAQTICGECVQTWRIWGKL
jgi:hypothetical protein